MNSSRHLAGQLDRHFHPPVPADPQSDAATKQVLASGVEIDRLEVANTDRVEVVSSQALSSDERTEDRAAWRFELGLDFHFPAAAPFPPLPSLAIRSPVEHPTRRFRRRLRGSIQLIRSLSWNSIWCVMRSPRSPRRQEKTPIAPSPVKARRRCDGSRGAYTRSRCGSTSS